MKNNNKPKEDERQRVGKQLSFALYGATSRMIRSHRPFLEPLGLTFPQFLVMVTLYEKIPRTVGEIGAEVTAASLLTPQGSPRDQITNGGEARLPPIHAIRWATAPHFRGGP